MKRTQIGFFVEDGKEDGDIRYCILWRSHACSSLCGNSLISFDSEHYAAVRTFSSIHRFTSLSAGIRFRFAIARTLLKRFPSISTEWVRLRSTSTSTLVKYSL